MAHEIRLNLQSAARVMRNTPAPKGVKRVVYIRRDVHTRLLRETSLDFDVGVIFRPVPVIICDTGPKVAIAAVFA